MSLDDAQWDRIITSIEGRIASKRIQAETLEGYIAQQSPKVMRVWSELLTLSELERILRYQALREGQRWQFPVLTVSCPGSHESVEIPENDSPFVSAEHSTVKQAMLQLYRPVHTDLEAWNANYLRLEELQRSIALLERDLGDVQEIRVKLDTTMPPDD